MKVRKKKLIVMIPAFNEENSIQWVIVGVPKKIEGFDKIETIVINDGSTDKTAKVAKESGADVISHENKKGLGAAFQTGINTALAKGADVIVNIDADMQFNPADIPKLTAPIVAGQADMVTATRFKNKDDISKNMPHAKKIGNFLFTKLVNILTGQKFTDSQCGFRAYSREAAIRLNLFGTFTYTQEVFFDLISKGLRIKEIPIKVKYYKNRNSHISSSLLNYGLNALIIILRTFRDWRPLLFFAIPGLAAFGTGVLFSLYFSIYWLIHHQTTPVKTYGSVGVVCLILGFLLIILALIADMFKRLRRNQEEIIYQLRRENYKHS